MRVAILSFREPGFSWPLHSLAQYCLELGFDVSTFGLPNFRDGRRHIDEEMFGVGVWWDLGTISAQYAALSDFLRNDSFDVVIAPQLMVGARAATMEYAVPHVTFGMGMVDFSGTTLYAAALHAFRDASTDLPSPKEFLNRLRSLGRSVQGSNGWRQLSSFEDLFGSTLLVRGPKGRYGNEGYEQVTEVGTALSAPPTSTVAGLTFQNAGQAPLVSLYWGRTFGYTGVFDALLAALLESKIHVLIDAARLDYIPERYKQMVHGNLPFDFAFRQNARMITNGHTSSCLAAYKYRLPTLFVPTGSGTDELTSEYHSHLSESSLLVEHNGLSNEALRRAIQELIAIPHSPENKPIEEDDWHRIAVDALIRAVST